MVVDYPKMSEEEAELKDAELDGGQCPLTGKVTSAVVNIINANRSSGGGGSGGASVSGCSSLSSSASTSQCCSDNDHGNGRLAIPAAVASSPGTSRDTSGEAALALVLADPVAAKSPDSGVISGASVCSEPGVCSEDRSEEMVPASTITLPTHHSQKTVKVAHLSQSPVEIEFQNSEPVRTGIADNLAVGVSGVDEQAHCSTQQTVASVQTTAMVGTEGPSSANTTMSLDEEETVEPSNDCLTSTWSLPSGAESTELHNAQSAAVVQSAVSSNASPPTNIESVNFIWNQLNRNDQTDISHVESMMGKCRVCEEPSAGFHFGAYTCEGCKSFFCRNHRKQSLAGVCVRGGCCNVVGTSNRSICKACRMKKCIEVGMHPANSRFGRRPAWMKNGGTSPQIPAKGHAPGASGSQSASLKMKLERSTNVVRRWKTTNQAALAASNLNSEMSNTDRQNMGMSNTEAVLYSSSGGGGGGSSNNNSVVMWRQPPSHTVTQSISQSPSLFDHHSLTAMTNHQSHLASLSPSFLANNTRVREEASVSPSESVATALEYQQGAESSARLWPPLSLAAATGDPSTAAEVAAAAAAQQLVSPSAVASFYRLQQLAAARRLIEFSTNSELHQHQFDHHHLHHHQQQQQQQQQLASESELTTRSVGDHWPYTPPPYPGADQPEWSQRLMVSPQAVTMSNCSSDSSSSSGPEGGRENQQLLTEPDDSTVARDFEYRRSLTQRSPTPESDWEVKETPIDLTKKSDSPNSDCPLDLSYRSSQVGPVVLNLSRKY